MDTNKPPPLSDRMPSSPDLTHVAAAPSGLGRKTVRQWQKAKAVDDFFVAGASVLAGWALGDKTKTENDGSTVVTERQFDEGIAKFRGVPMGGA